MPPFRSEDLVDSLNQTLFLALNAGEAPWSGVVLFALVAAKALILLVPLHLILIWVGGERAVRFVALSALLALVIAIAINGVVGALVYSPRPFVIGLGHTLIEHRPNSSFPSNHATVFFTYAASLAVYGRRTLAAWFIGIGLVVAWSRIYLGIHYPGDMLGAALVSGVAAVLSASIMMRFGPMLLERSDAVYTGLTTRLSRLGSRRA
jgi:undecaprenyl-diphosphatase